MSNGTNNKETSTLVPQNSDNKLSETFNIDNVTDESKEIRDKISNEGNETKTDDSSEENDANCSRINSVTTMMLPNDENSLNVNERQYEIKSCILKVLKYILILILLHTCLGFILFVVFLCTQYYLFFLYTFSSTIIPVLVLSCICIKWEEQNEEKNSNHILYFIKHLLSQLIKYKHYKLYKKCKISWKIFQGSNEIDVPQNYKKSIRNIEDLRYFVATNAILQGSHQCIAQIWILLHLSDNIFILSFQIPLIILSNLLIICCLYVCKRGFCDYRNDLGIWRVSIFTHFITVMSMFLYCSDIVSDLIITIRYYWYSHYIRGTVTLVFVIVPGVYNTWHEHYRAKVTFNINKKLLIAMILNLNPLYGYWKTMKLLLKTRKAELQEDEEQQKNCYLEYIKSNFTVAISRYNECFTESCCQLIINISYLLVTIDFSAWQNEKLGILSSVISVLNVAVSLVLFFRSKRISKHKEDPLPIMGMIIQFLGYLPVASRIVSLSFLASIYPLYTVLSMFLHWLIIFLWTVQTSEDHSLSTHLNNGGQAFIYIFTPAINSPIIEIIFQIVFFAENIAAMLIWGFSVYGQIATYVVCLWEFAIVLLSIIGWICRYLYRTNYDRWIQNYKNEFDLRNMNTLS